jgi:hypothetical protein
MISKYLRVFSLLCLLALVTNCEVDDTTQSELSNYVGFEISNPMVIDVENNATQTYDVNVYASDVSSVDRSYGLSIDDESTLATSFTVPDVVTIPAGINAGTFTVSITDDDNLQFVAQTVIINFEDEVGVDFSDAIVLNVTEKCLDTIVTLTLTLDTWPDETSWELYDLSGDPVVIASDGPFVNPDDDFAVKTYDFCLASGDYGIVVYDSYGDGISNDQGGGYVISIDGTVLVSGLVTSTSGSSTFTVN